MGKDKSKKKSGKPEKSSKKGRSKEVIEDAVIVEDFPEKAAPAADETPAATTEDWTTIKPKRRREIEKLHLGVAHELPHVEHLYRMKVLLKISRHEVDTLVGWKLKPKKAAKLADEEIARYRVQGEARMHNEAVAEKKSKKKAAADKVETDAIDPDPIVVETSPELDAETKAAKARVQARREKRAAELIAEGVDPEDAKNRALMGIEAEDRKASADARHDEADIEVSVVGFLFNMKRKHRKAFLEEVRRQTGDGGVIPESGDFGRSKAAKTKAKAYLDGFLAKLIDPELDTTAADAIADVDLGADDPLGKAAKVHLDGEDAHAAKLKAQVEADELDPDGHNIDDVLVKNGRPYLVPAGVEWDGQDESVLKPYTRVTNWIDVLDDKSQLTDWKLRTTLAGVAALDELDPDGTDLIDLVRAADVEAEAAVAKLDKKSRKGKLDPGEYAEAVDEVARTYKKTVDEIVERALDQGGAFEKAKRGTHLHSVFEAFDLAYIASKGKLTVDEWIGENPVQDDGPLTIKGREVIPADIVDLKAYRAAMDEAGIEVIECERRVVNDAHGTTGTFDRGLRVKLAGATRATKVIGDLKTGRVDYGAGKITQQIEEYAQGDYYDTATGERERTGYSKTVGILIHSPAGEGRTTIYVVDLKVGARRNKLAVEVKAERARSTEAQAYRGKEPFYTVLVDPGNDGLHLTPGQKKKLKADA